VQGHTRFRFEVSMIIVFMKKEYDTADEKSMVRLQAALDHWEIGKRVADKKVAAVLQAQPNPRPGDV